jgi:lysyl-tRNA synthetase class 1
MSSAPPLSAPPSVVDAAAVATAWPFEEARKLVARVARTGQSEVLFETGYGPSGLPHIGTFGEVARTTMVREAFRVLTEDSIRTHLIVFSDDMDGLRKVPDNIPNREAMAPFLGRPLSRIPDPFAKFESFAHHNNAMLRDFLDRFGFDYEFMSSSAAYASGRFDRALLLMLERYDAVLSIMLPSLRRERAATYSPFLPIHPRTGVVMQVPIEAVDTKAGTITWRDIESGERFETSVIGGKCKLQWKPDWAMRWFALEVDYEMAGKDLIDSVRLSGEIVSALGGMPPEGFNYELFLDENGQKISKSKGNGLTIDEWLTYASPQSLSLFMYQKPMAAKRLYFDVIPRAVDEYLSALESYPRQTWKERLGNPVWHVHAGAPPAPEVLVHPSGSVSDAATSTVSFAMLLNLVAVSNSEDARVLWGFLQRYAPGASPDNHPHLDSLVGYALRYYRAFVRPAKKYRAADSVEREALMRLSDVLASLPSDASAQEIQAALYDVARPIPRYQDYKAKNATPDRPGVSSVWFNSLYQILLGEERGPRFGSFVALYGIAETQSLIEKALDGELIKQHEAFLAALKIK